MDIKIMAGLVKELMKEFSKQYNVPVYQGTPYCRNRLKNALTCKGCESEQGCNAFRTILTRSILMRITSEKLKEELNQKSFLHGYQNTEDYMGYKIVMLGVIGVDSGQLLVTDPCYLESENYNYDEICNKTQSKNHGGQLNYKAGALGLAVVFTTGLGDGMYPVFAKIGKVKGLGERVKEIIIKFI